MGKYVMWMGGVVTLLVALLLFYPNLFLRVPEPVRSGDLTLPGLNQPVTVHYDAYAVPHIYAENEHDLFFAAGYIMASERMFQMDMVNRAVQGRLAEMDAGLIDTDKYLRTWGFHRIGRQLARAMDVETRRIVQWSCDGINAYIGRHLDDLPLEFKLVGHRPLEWDPSILGGYVRLMGHELTQAWSTEIMYTRLVDQYGEERVKGVMPAYPDDKPTIVPPGFHASAPAGEDMTTVKATLHRILGLALGLGGSNSWVVSGSRSATGQPLLANDPHLGFVQPAKWYEMHLVGGRFNVRGVCLPGMPLVVIGHNEHIAWGFTNVMTDDADFYLEEVNPQDPAAYRYKGQWLPFTEHQEIIPVKGAEPVTFTVRETVHGVVINAIHDLAREWEQPITMRWTGQDITDELTAFVRLNLASNWDEFSQAVRLYAVPGQNMIYADREGNIGWRPAVRLPIRKAADSPFLKPGATGEWDWQGYVPFDEMPYLFNPPSGYIATANNKTIGDDYPHYISIYWADPSRIDRIIELLKAQEKHSIASFMAIQTDIRPPFARELTPYLLAAFTDVSQVPSVTELEQNALEQLRRWDFSMGTRSVATTIFHVWFQELVTALLQDELDAAGKHVFDAYLRTDYLLRQELLALLAEGESPWFDNRNTPEVEDREAIIRQSFAAAVKQLREELGGDVGRWAWGRLHTLTHPHDLAGGGRLGKFLDWWLDLNVGPFPAPGSGATVNALGYSMTKPFRSSYGPSFRTIIDLSNLDSSRIVLPTGQSGNPFSRHYRDQAELYNAGQYRPVDFSREAVERAAVTTLTLRP